MSGGVTKAGGLIVLAAGGTGGHVMPAQAVAGELVARGYAVAVLTDPRGARFEAGFAGAPLTVLPAATFAGRRGLGRVTAFKDILWGFLVARRTLKRWRARAVVGFGGYPALAPLAAAVTLRLPTCLHEQNAVLGRVNRLMAPRLGALALSFAETARLAPGDRARAVVTGNPVRPEIRPLDDAPYVPAVAAGPFELLILGGSLGAHILSVVVPAAVAALPSNRRDRLRIVHQARADDLEDVRCIYAGAGVAAEVSSFFADVPTRLARAHLVIARSGASMTAELAIAGRPAILVPFAAAADDHQSVNASVLAEVGGAWILPETTFTATELAARLDHFMTVPGLLLDAAKAAFSVAKPDAACRLADVVDALIEGRPTQPERAAA